jgi:DNA-binding transcriptional ArsR family regulator
MAKRSNRTLRLENRGQLAALVSPVRVEIAEHLQARGPCTSAELARDLARSRSSLYYHLHRLVEVGLVTETPDSGGARAEARYALASERIAIPAGVDRAGTELVARGISAMLRRAERNAKRALQNGLLATRASGPRAAFASRKIWLTSEGLARVHAELGRLEGLLARENRRSEGVPFLFTYAMSPILEQRSNEAP